MLKKNLSKILYIQLALEGYDLNTGKTNKTLERAYQSLTKFREAKKALGEEEQLKQSFEVLDKLDKALDSIGREKFKFYEDGSVEYIWDKSLKTNKKTK